MTAADLTDIFLAALIRAHGSTKARWRKVLGRPRVYDRETHPHCNWSFAPSGSVVEVAAVENLADRLRGEYPIVSDG
ncbi:hypothetical protein [Sphingosinithalassobacter portus]|uniref:hypothetical protein n=1 Tax=Stakelama portus TaxID=2676234 RepID=UPI000D6E82F2|nr:hypothetical protein [Sphingosinithalassobacter portus]